MRNPIGRRAAVMFAAALLTGAAFGAAAQSPAPQPETRLVGVVNVNTANAQQLELLPTVGPARAAAIIEHRKQHGPFKRVEDLTRVSGVGEHALERIRPHCVLEGKTTATLKR